MTLPSVRRLRYAHDLSRFYAPHYLALCGVLSEEWQPVSGLRSFQQQGQLYAQGRTAPGPVVTRAKPGMSFHNYGLATDWAYFPEGVYTPLSHDDPKWKEYLDACEKVGLRCLDFERPHNELTVTTPIAVILAAYELNGEAGVSLLLAKEFPNG